MTDRPIEAVDVRFHAQELALAAHALFWADDETRAHHEQTLRETFDKLVTSYVALSTEISGEPEPEPDDEPREYDDSGYRRDMIDAGRGHLLR
jgi:hypothetical protein